MNMKQHPFLGTLLGLGVFCAGAAQARPIDELDTLHRTALNHETKQQLHQLGYERASRDGHGSNRTEYWLSHRNGTCAALELHDGIIKTITRAKSRRCESESYQDHEPYEARTSHAEGSHDAAVVAKNQMTRYCAGEAAGRFSTSPRSVSTLPLEQSHGKYFVYGQYESRGNIKTFTCTFSQEGRFVALVGTS
ncbi:hypothetical protein [Aeromonas bivalvium]|uniref:hypothetical protein n=1 Tax=Aeromonas bivalvium TaxID=440079 RepID=UPI0038D0ACA3